jgi:hypothetical protein
VIGSPRATAAALSLMSHNEDSGTTISHYR